MIQVSEKGSILRSYSSRFESKLSRMIIGKSPGLSLKQARDKRDQLRAILASGHDPKHAKLGEENADVKITIKDAIEYLPHVVEQLVG
ncbi:TPA: Arm DNA-binding domain-containing protein [Providencia alcalifaciens]